MGRSCVLIYCVKLPVTHWPFYEKEITEIIVLMGVGSTDISSIQELRAAEPKSEVTDLLQQRVTNCSFWVTAAEYWRQQLLSLAASLDFTKMITAAENTSHQRTWAVFAYPCGPSVLSLLTARIFTQGSAFMQIAGRLMLCKPKSQNTESQTQVKHYKLGTPTLESCISHNPWALFPVLTYQYKQLLLNRSDIYMRSEWICRDMR